MNQTSTKLQSQTEVDSEANTPQQVAEAKIPGSADPAIFKFSGIYARKGADEAIGNRDGNKYQPRTITPASRKTGHQRQLRFPMAFKGNQRIMR
jgi:hypothetical protein